MLKWLAQPPPSPPTHRLPPVTDDPLATIHVHRPLEIYAVSRVNPIFHEEDSKRSPKYEDARYHFTYQTPSRQDIIQRSPEFHGLSCSSGYGSNRCNSSSEYSSSGAEEGDGGYGKSGVARRRANQTIPRPENLRDDTLTVLEQNIGFVKSILVAVKGGSTTGLPTSSRKHCGGNTTLSTIPEGKVDYSIPRPVWPRSDENMECHDTRQHSPQGFFEVPSDFTMDDSILLCGSRACPSSSEEKMPSNETPRVSQRTMDLIKQQSVSSQLLRELSNTLSIAIDEGMTTSEEVIKEISRLSNSLERHKSRTGNVSSEDALRRLSLTMSHRESLAKVSRALRSSSSSSCSSSVGGSLRAATASSSPRNAERRLLLLRRLRRAETTRDPPASSASSSSSSASSSGFSDRSTVTPPSSESSVSHQPATLDHPVFLHEDLVNVPNGLRNAMIYGTIFRMNQARSGSANGVYEKLVSATAKLDVNADDRDGDRRKAMAQQDSAIWETYCGTGVMAGDVRLKSASLYGHAAPYQPDFTLDLPRAESLMRKIKAAKRRRCWCRIVTSFLGLVFFLMSVMVVSMMVTRGKRMFGPI